MYLYVFVTWLHIYFAQCIKYINFVCVCVCVYMVLVLTHANVVHHIMILLLNLNSHLFCVWLCVCLIIMVIFWNGNTFERKIVSFYDGYTQLLVTISFFFLLQILTIYEKWYKRIRDDRYVGDINLQFIFFSCHFGYSDDDDDDDLLFLRFTYHIQVQS